jgi:basic amino acid/polyamine antiporter, APA family
MVQEKVTVEWPGGVSAARLHVLMPLQTSDTVGQLADEGLVRAIGVRALTAGTLNCIVGAGIFVLPAVAAQGLGPAAILSYLVCALAMGLVVLCFAAVGSRVSSSGGVYAYGEAAFGPFVGFVLGAVHWFAAGVVASASVATALVGTLAETAPVIATPACRAAVILGVYGIFAAVNIRGVQSAAKVTEGITVIKLLPLLLLACAGLLLLRPDNLAWHDVPTLAAVGQSALLVIFAFAGTEIAVTPGGEIRNPAKTLPRAILLALALATALYLALQVAAQGVLGGQLARETNAPLAATAQQIVGSGGKGLLLLAAAVSMLGYLSVDALATPRMLFAFARDGVGPSWLATVHPRFRTPAAAILVNQGISAILALTGTFRSLLILANLGALIIYFGVAAASIELQRRDVRTEGTPFRLPGGVSIPVLACLVIAWLASNATRADALAAGAMLVGAAVVFGFNALVKRRTVVVPG